MTVRYAGASEIRAVSRHEKDREPDGSSAIDLTRSHLNKILYGPATQQEALEDLWALGVKKPTAQAEAPYVQMVLSASSSYFRKEGQGPGEWDQAKLDLWIEKTMKWLRDEYGDDFVHASLHVDEDTPHFHVLIVPTYSKRSRVPGRKKRNETDEEFQLRKLEALSAETVRTAGRASSEYWSRKWARLDARKSYHAAVESLGIGYGRDFVGEDQSSPEHKTTGKWVREEAARLSELGEDLKNKGLQLQQKETDLAKREQRLKANVAQVKSDLDKREAALEKHEDAVSRLLERVKEAIQGISKFFGFNSQSLDKNLKAAEEQLAALKKPDPSPDPFSKTKELPDEPTVGFGGPGF
ncbi:plasmid recombination enzyme [mine drainage metagenome]|uniref:Plasmid recombination enzyme n=1 Tax=mine drainage metagenome TaxID=410659 RepID=A0A1J5PG98_9ZZZZ